MREFDREHLQDIAAVLENDIRRAQAALVERLGNSRSEPMTGCTSYVQRKLGIGYNAASAILEEMVKRGMITDVDRNGARRLLPSRS